MPLLSVRVLPNPSLVCDHEGLPSCAIPLPDDPSAFIGAVREFVPDGGEVPLFPGLKSGRYVFKFDTVTPVELFGERAIAYARSFAKHAELLPADEASAKALGVAWAAPKFSKKPEADK
jgi:hypothetical protein